MTIASRGHSSKGIRPVKVWLTTCISPSQDGRAWRSPAASGSSISGAIHRTVPLRLVVVLKDLPAIGLGTHITVARPKSVKHATPLPSMNLHERRPVNANIRDLW